MHYFLKQFGLAPLMRHQEVAPRNNCHQYKYPNALMGFSLIELLVSMTIFSVVMTMAAGTLLVLLDANAKAQNKQQILNNLTIAIDSMSREIRTGYNYFCASSAPSSPPAEDVEQDCSPGQYLAIVEAGDSLTRGAALPRIEYRYNGSEQSIERRLPGGSWQPITASNTDITNAQFIVTGTAGGDDEQPTVTIFIQGQAGQLAETDVEFEIQTSVTQRPLDI
jgi:prepilin-type N-terminal cleavage/methylation domain-containing protein